MADENPFSLDFDTKNVGMKVEITGSRPKSFGNYAMANISEGSSVSPTTGGTAFDGSRGR